MLSAMLYFPFPVYTFSHAYSHMFYYFVNAHASSSSITLLPFPLPVYTPSHAYYSHALPFPLPVYTPSHAPISLASRAERGIKVLLPYICTFTFGSSLLARSLGKTRNVLARSFADFHPGLAHETDFRLVPAFSPQRSASRTDRHQGSTHRKPAFPRTSPACSTNFPCFLLIQSECNNF